MIYPSSMHCMGANVKYSWPHLVQHEVRMQQQQQQQELCSPVSVSGPQQYPDPESSCSDVGDVVQRCFWEQSIVNRKAVGSIS